MGKLMCAQTAYVSKCVYVCDHNYVPTASIIIHVCGKYMY